MVIIYANFEVLLFKMIHIMFQGNRHRSSEEEDFFYHMTAILVV